MFSLFPALGQEDWKLLDCVGSSGLGKQKLRLLAHFGLPGSGFPFQDWVKWQQNSPGVPTPWGPTPKPLWCDCPSSLPIRRLSWCLSPSLGTTLKDWGMPHSEQENPVLKTREQNSFSPLCILAEQPLGQTGLCGLAPHKAVSFRPPWRWRKGLTTSFKCTLQVHLQVRQDVEAFFAVEFLSLAAADMRWRSPMSGKGQQPSFKEKWCIAVKSR